jgi:hypothetical protein
MPTFRGLATYQDATPGATDRLLFETSGGQPRGVAPNNFLSNVSEDTSPDLGGTLDGNGNSIIDYTAPHVAGVSGTLTQAAHGGRPIFITGTVTVPVTSGFVCLIRNKSGSSKTIEPASGVLIHNGGDEASISLPNKRELLVHSDGTDVWCSGAIV